MDCRRLVCRAGLASGSRLRRAVNVLLLSLRGATLHSDSPGVFVSCEAFPQLLVDSNTLHVPFAGVFKAQSGVFSSLPQHFSLIYANREAKFIVRESYYNLKPQQNQRCDSNSFWVL